MAIVSCLLMAAHVLRTGWFFLAGVCLAMPLLLLARQAWVRRILQLVLVLAAAEWARTLVVLAQARQQTGQPWTRMALILGAVAAWTLTSAILLTFVPRRTKMAAEP